jgi:hypothetical protein
MIQKPLNAQNFPHLFFAGRSRITLQNSAKGSHVRLKISEKREKKDGKMVGTGRFFVFTSILNDGDTGWDFAGTFYSDTVGYSLGRTHTKGSQVDRILGFRTEGATQPSGPQREESQPLPRRTLLPLRYASHTPRQHPTRSRSRLCEAHAREFHLQPHARHLTGPWG